MSSPADSGESYSFRFHLPQGVGFTEEVEEYRTGGFHPVHLGDKYDGGRYRIVHKLGYGGFSTVWLAQDEEEEKWVALKIVKAENSSSISVKCTLGQSALHGSDAAQRVAEHQRQFIIDGPNGQHLCLVLPVLGPSTAELSYHFTCRLTPSFARRVAYQATRAVADLHSQGLCHGDVTTGNLVLALSDLHPYSEDDIYQLFGEPTTGELEQESGEPSGPDAPRYIVKSIDFVRSTSRIIEPEVKLVDFDQCFPISSPPTTMLGTPVENLAPEVAIGRAAGPASDVWALGCCIFRLRSGKGVFENPWEVTEPASVVRYILHILKKEMPRDWYDTTRWDEEGYPTGDVNKGHSHEQFWHGKEQTLHELVYDIWDQPRGGLALTRDSEPDPKPFLGLRSKSFPSHYSDMVWNPSAIKVNDTNLTGYNDQWQTLRRALPSISEDEAALLYDLLSKIFVLEPTSRPTARELLDHPWFHLDRSNHDISDFDQ